MWQEHIYTNSEEYLNNLKLLQEKLKEFESSPDNDAVIHDDNYLTITRHYSYSIEFARIIDVEEGVGARDNTFIDTSYSKLYIEKTPSYSLTFKKDISPLVKQHISNYYK